MKDDRLIELLIKAWVEAIDREGICFLNKDESIELIKLINKNKHGKKYKDFFDLGNFRF